jgi:hypothetical protein
VGANVNGWRRVWDRAKRGANTTGAGIGERETCYCTRHCRISDLLQLRRARRDLQAKLCGNSPDVILKQYLHLGNEAIQRKLANL